MTGFTHLKRRGKSPVSSLEIIIMTTVACYKINILSYINKFRKYILSKRQRLNN